MRCRSVEINTVTFLLSTALIKKHHKTAYSAKIPISNGDAKIQVCEQLTHTSEHSKIHRARLVWNWMRLMLTEQNAIASFFINTFYSNYWTTSKCIEFCRSQGLFERSHFCMYSWVWVWHQHIAGLCMLSKK